MSIIHITDGQEDQILADITAKNILSNNHHKSLKDNLERFDFETFSDKRFSEHLGKMNRVIIPDEDGGYIEFVIHEAIRNMDRQIEVYTSASYLMLKKSKVINPQTLESQTTATVAAFALNGTEWQPGVMTFAGIRSFTIESRTNPFALLKRIANEFDLELRFRIETDGNQITGRYVDLVERVGEWQGREAEFGKDLIGIKRSEKTDDIVTALVGLGPEREDGTRLEVFVDDQDALARWGRNGQHIIEPYEPESADQDMTEERLTTLTTTELNKRINALVEYETTIVDLEHVPGMENKKIRFGDTIKIKDTKFNPPLYLEARVHTQDRDIVDKSQKVVELGDYIEYTEEEVNAIWKSLQAQIREKITQYDLVEYTYPKADIDDKDESVFSDGTIYSDAVATTAEDNAKQHADTKAGEAEQNAKDYAVSREAYDAKVAEIMGDLADKVGLEYVDSQLVLKADSSVVSGLQNEVANKVDAEWVNGQLVSKADANSVYVINEIDNKFDNVVSVTQYETDKNGIITDLQSQESRISQTETDISSKVEQITFNQLADDVGGIGSELSTAKTSIEQNAAAIQSKAEQSTVNTLTGEVSTLESIQIQQAGLISDRVEKTVYQADQDGVINFMNSTNSWRTQTDTAINQRVTSATYNTGIGNLQAEIDTQEGDIEFVGNIVSQHTTAINQNATQIELMVKDTDLDGNELISRINLTSSTATIKAENIDLVGAVTVLSDISGELGDVRAGSVRTENGAESTTLSNAQLALVHNSFQIQTDLRFDGLRFNESNMYQANLVYNRTGSSSLTLHTSDRNLNLSAPNGEVIIKSTAISLNPGPGGTVMLFGEVDFSGAQITDFNLPNQDASKITSGIFNVARIPNLATSKITSGTFPIARIPTGTTSTTVAVGNHNHDGRYPRIFGDNEIGFGYTAGGSLTLYVNNAYVRVV